MLQEANKEKAQPAIEREESLALSRVSSVVVPADVAAAFGGGMDMSAVIKDGGGRGDMMKSMSAGGLGAGAGSFDAGGPISMSSSGGAPTKLDGGFTLGGGGGGGGASTATFGTAATGAGVNAAVKTSHLVLPIPKIFLT